jgi:hypothetical protein
VAGVNSQLKGILVLVDCGAAGRYSERSHAVRRVRQAGWDYLPEMGKHSTFGMDRD